MPARRAVGLIALSILVAVAVVAGALPWPARWMSADEGAPERPWRAGLWVSAWAVLPTYGVYCRSVNGFAAPADGLHGVSLIVVVLLAALAVAAVVWRPTRAAATPWLSVVAVVLVVLVGCQAIAVVMRAMERPAASEWVPRYLGFAWPAVAVAVGAALARVPTTVGRWAAVSMVMAANLGLFAYRLAGDTEPPVDRMAADVWVAQRHDGHAVDTLVWSQLPYHPTWQTGPAEGQLFGDVGRYYLQRQAGREPMTPDRFKASLSTFVIHNDGGDDDASTDVAALLARRPGVRHLVVWDHAFWPAATPGDRLSLPAGWHRTADERWTVRNVWTGQDVARYRRRAFVLTADTPGKARG